METERDFGWDEEEDLEFDEDFEESESDERGAAQPSLLPDPLEHPF